MSAHDALVLMDMLINHTPSDAVRDAIVSVRGELVSGPEWSEVQEGNLRAELDRVRGELRAAYGSESSEQRRAEVAEADLREARLDIAHMDRVLLNMRGSRDGWRGEARRLAAELACERVESGAAHALMLAALRHVEGERDRARRTAVALEQELAVANGLLTEDGAA